MSDYENLPEAVRRQAKEAEKLQKQMYGAQGQGEENAPEKVSEPGQETNAGTPEEKGFETASQAQPEHKERKQEKAPEEAHEEDWEKRFRHYKGQTDYSLFQERQRNQDLTSQIGQLQTQLNETRQALEVLQSKQKTDPRSFLPEELVDSLGEETASDVVSVAEQVSKNVSSKYEQTISRLEGKISQLEGTQKKSERTNSVNQLLAVVGEINKSDLNGALGIDRDPGFHQWLNANRDPYSGRTFMDLYHVAGGSGDAHRVADFQRQWKATNNHKSQGSPFERKITPDRTNGATHVRETGQNGRLWTGQEISKFYQDKMRRKYSPEEAARLEQDIFAAQREGRIVDRKPVGGRAM